MLPIAPVWRVRYFHVAVFIAAVRGEPPHLKPHKAWPRRLAERSLEQCLSVATKYTPPAQGIGRFIQAFGGHEWVVAEAETGGQVKVANRRAEGLVWTVGSVLLWKFRGTAAA